MQREQPFGSWEASRVTPDAVQDVCSWLVASGFFFSGSLQRSESNIPARGGKGA